MRKIALSLALLLTVSMTSCWAGPKQLARTVDDWDRKLYVEQPILNVVLNVFLVIPFAGALASFADTIVTNPYALLVNGDLYDGKGGTNFQHLRIDNAGKNMKSLLADGEFLKIDMK